MSEIELLVEEQKKASTSFFLFLLRQHSYGQDERRSEIFEVANMAQVYFNIFFKDEIFRVSLFYKKKGFAENSVIKMNVKCEALNFSTTNTCEKFYLNMSLANLDTEEEVIKINGNSIGDVYSASCRVSLRVYREENISNPYLYEDQEFTDFELSADGGSVAVHKLCLAARSDVFKRMFLGDWKETAQNRYDLKDVTVQTAQHLKDFIYLGKLPDDGLRPLIVVARKYMFDDLVAACATKLADTVVAEELNSLHELACSHDIPALTRAIAELTPPSVVNGAYEIEMTKNNSALKDDTN